MESSKVAFVVGIGNYTNTDCNELKYCPSSAREVYNYLTHQQYGCFDQERSILLLGEEQNMMTAEELEKNIKNTISKLSVKDEFLFFFCGHGKVNSSEQLQLLMSNYSEEENLNYFSIDKILDYLKERGITKIVLIIDACRSEAMLSSMKSYQNKDIKFAWSCSKNEYSYQSDEFKRTYFSYYFCEGIEGWAEKEDMKLSLLIKYIDRKNKEKKVEQSAVLYGNITGDDISISKGRKKYPDIPFSNRKEEVKQVLKWHNEDKSSCLIIDALAGYGKTVLLKKIKRILEEQGGYCILTTVESESSEDIFVRDVLFLLNSASVLENKDKKQIVVNIKNEIDAILAKNIAIVNFTFSFLIDFDDYPSSKVVKYIIDEFITKIVKSYNFSEKIKFILSGRHLLSKINDISPNNLLVKSEDKICLSPFSYNITKNALLDFFKAAGKTGINNDIVSMSAACLVFFSGGHPGCIASVLEEQSKDISIVRDPYDSFIANRDDIYIKHFKPVADNIINSFKEEKRELIEKFSIFRYTTSKMIMEFLKFETVIERDNFTDYLLRTYLFSKDGLHLYKDNIIRNVIANNFKIKEPDLFSDLCRRAQDICLKHITKMQYSECLVAEYLFQIFQEFSANHNNTEDINKRAEFREKISEHINLALKTYTGKDIDDQDDSVLQKFIKDDYELEFIANYCLRKTDEIYSDEPFEKIKDEIRLFFQNRRRIKND